MHLIGSAGQRTGQEYFFDASGTITTGGTPQLLLPKAYGRSSLLIENISDTNMFIEIGGPRATAALSNGGVSGCTITNAGFGYSLPPKITFYGGAYINTNQITPTYTLPGLPDYFAPNTVAKAHCVMTGNPGAMTVSSIVIDNPGKGYAYPPYVFIHNDPNDPFGAASPSATNGILILPNGGSYNPDGTVTTTDQVSIFCATTGKPFTCKFTT